MPLEDECLGTANPPLAPVAAIDVGSGSENEEVGEQAKMDPEAINELKRTRTVFSKLLATGKIEAISYNVR